MKIFRRSVFDVELVLTVAGWLCLASGCIEFGGKESSLDPDEAIASENGDLLGLFTPDHEPPTLGKNALDFDLTDADGAPITGASVAVTPFMPSMGHGSPETPVVKEGENGGYVATNIVYIMKGEWRLTIDVDDGSTKDSFVLYYEVE